MANRFVRVAEIEEAIVTTPHISPNGFPWSDVLLDDPFQGGCVAILDDFEEDQLRTVLDATDEPILADDTTNVIIAAHDVGFVDLHDGVRSANLYSVVRVGLDEHISEPLTPLLDGLLIHF
ncbi:hypothetical protein V3C99_015644 [Haemonchus contortus]